jgi:hypothetical protein
MYTEQDLRMAWVAGYRSAEYRFRVLPTHVIGSGSERRHVLSERAELDVARAEARGDNRTFSQWLAEYEEKLARRAKHGVDIEPDGMRILPKQSTDNVPPII